MAKTKTGIPSFGYQRRDSMLVPHPQEAPIRRRIFELFIEHQRKNTVAEILNAEGVTTRSGASFNGQTIRRLLLEEKVTGIPGVAQAIVSKKLFDQCKVILQSQSRDGGAKRKVVNLFAGFIYCSCGQKMYVPTKSKKYICADCLSKIPTDDLEAIFCSQISSYKLPKLLESDFSDLTHLWPTLPFATKREIIECVTRRIEVDHKRVTCYLVTL